MSSRRTCDRCYKVKAKCVYNADQKVCVRCDRLEHSCTSQRAILQPGRPRLSTKPKDLPTASDVIIPSSSSLTREIPFLTIKGYNEGEISLLEYALHSEQISSIIYGPSFQRTTRSNFIYALSTAGDEVKDAFLAFAKALSDNRYHFGDGLVSPEDAARGSRALGRLITVQARTIEDARTALSIALLVITFNDIKVGAPTLPIARAALLQAEPWQQQLTSQANTSNLISLLFIELFECLTTGQIPVFRYESTECQTMLDPYYGICYQLLPCLYDISVMFSSIRQNEISQHEINEQSKRTLLDVMLWDPELVLQPILPIIKEIEQRHFLLQAKAFKAAAQLLLIQAQLNETPAFRRAAADKAREIELYVQKVRQLGPNRPKYLLFPYFVACLELYDVERGTTVSIRETMNDISNNMAPKACESMLACLQHIWCNKHLNPDLAWFQCIEEGISFGMGP